MSSVSIDAADVSASSPSESVPGSDGSEEEHDVDEFEDRPVFDALTEEWPSAPLWEWMQLEAGTNDKEQQTD
ncbi:unnamed protein product, partial [Amoebophrya sp. A25]|eukprot:GSA25T00013262001.1